MLLLLNSVATSSLVHYCISHWPSSATAAELYWPPFDSPFLPHTGPMTEVNIALYINRISGVDETKEVKKRGRTRIKTVSHGGGGSGSGWMSTDRKLIPLSIYIGPICCASLYFPNPIPGNIVRRVPEGDLGRPAHRAEQDHRAARLLPPVDFRGAAFVLGARPVHSPVARDASAVPVRGDLQSAAAPEQHD